MGEQRVGVGSGTGLGHDESHDGLAGAWIGLAHHRDLGDLGVLEQRLFDLGRIDVEAGHDHEVLGPVDEAQLAVVVRDGDVAGAEPSVTGQRTGGGGGVVPVAREDVGAVDPDLTRVAREHVPAAGSPRPIADVVTIGAASVRP